jgi:hypothetical protein
MSHVLKVIIGFTVMIALGIVGLYFINQETMNNDDKSVNPVNAGAGCAARRDC